MIGRETEPGYVEVQRLLTQNDWLTERLTDLLVADAQRGGSAVIDHFRVEQLDRLSTMSFDIKSPGATRKVQEANEAVTTKVVFEALQEVIERVVERTRSKLAAPPNSV